MPNILMNYERKEGRKNKINKERKKTKNESWCDSAGINEFKWHCKQL
jgi:hypothetical protein